MDPPNTPSPSKKNQHRNCLTLAEHVQALKLLNSGKSARKVAIEMGVGRTQINDIAKRKSEVLEEYEQAANPNTKRRCQRTYDDINTLTWTWFQDVSVRNFNISGPMIQVKAREFAEELNLNEFKGSNGWLSCFLKRHNIVFRTKSGERGDVNIETVSTWKERLPEIIKDYEPKDIFNMDETGLFYRDSTRNGYIQKGDDCGGGKRSKERITVALCASMKGS